VSGDSEQSLDSLDSSIRAVNSRIQSQGFLLSSIMILSWNVVYWVQCLKVEQLVKLSWTMTLIST